jgi:hypothetical protein
VRFRAFVASVFRLAIVLQVTSSSYTAVWDVDRESPPPVPGVEEKTTNFHAETISTIFYWGMIEAGLAMIACCLPTLKPLISEHGIQSAIASVRSAISLHSLGNRSMESTSLKNSSSSKKASSYGKIEDGMVDQGPLRGDTVMEMNASVTHDNITKSEIEPGRITVKRDVDVSSQ